MGNLENDPLGAGGLAEFAVALRAGSISSETATQAYLARIQKLNPRLGAYQYVAVESAVETARAMDLLLSAGIDLGPLMGVPIAIKDLIAVDGMPTTAGTLLDVSDLIGSEGPVIKRLRQLGCVILGKVKTVEFALGITGVSAPQGTPLNAWDAKHARLPGGSSSGSAVATAAALCAFAIGSDTGGSVRVPAALNGIFGLKTSFGRFANDGAFPLAGHLDTIGLLTRSANDAAIAYCALSSEFMPDPVPVSTLRLGRPSNYFYDGIDPEVAERIQAALDSFEAAGARIGDLEVPEAPEREQYFPTVLPVCLIASLGRERATSGLHLMDPVIAKRVATGFDVSAIEFLELENRRTKSRKSALARFDNLDAWVSPTTSTYAPQLSELNDPEVGLAMALGMTRNTQPANYLDLTAASVPLPMAGHALPAGLQIMCPPAEETRVLAIALGLERLIGRPALPDVSGFAELDA